MQTIQAKKIIGNAQFLQSFEKFARHTTDTVRSQKNFTLEN